MNIQSPVVIDIGANLRSITIPIGQMIKNKNGRVYSFEAQRGIYYQLCGNIFSNQLVQTCTAYNIAVGLENGHIDVPLFFEIWGDYMQELIPKRSELLDYVRHTLGYETVIIGELCVAQHPQNKYFDIQIHTNNSLSMKRIK